MSYPQQGYPGQVPGGFVQQPQGQPQYQQAPPQQYAPPAPQYQQPQQGYYQPPVQQYAPPAPPTTPGSLDTFYSQPAVGGGKALKFDVIGQFYDVVFPRDVVDSDVQQQMTFAAPGQPSVPKTFRDGSPMYHLILPLLTADGQPATHYVKGPEREKMIEAMQRAGVQPDADGHYRPKQGDRARITYTGQTPTGFGQPRKDRDWQYVRADQAGGGMNTAQQFAQTPVPAPVQPQYGPGAPAASVPHVAGQYMPAPQAPVGQQPMVQQVPQPEQQFTPGAVTPPVQQAQAAPAGMTPEQFAAYQQLLGAAGGQPQQ